MKKTALILAVIAALFVGTITGGCATSAKPGPNYVWVKGHKGPSGKWVSGHWQKVGAPSAPGAKWVPGHHNNKGVWVPGHWK